MPATESGHLRDCRATRNIRYTWRGTHEGELRGIEPTGREVEASGMAFSRFEDGTIRKDWILDDTLSLFQQLGFIDSHEE